MVLSDIIIVGAGPAGLATAAALKQRGLDARVLDQAMTLASSWKGHYDDLRLNSVKWFSALPFMPMPRTFPKYPSRTQFISYLEAYARQFDIQPAFNTKVTRITRIPRPAEGWQLDTTAGQYRCKSLVIATGANSLPRLPDIPGLAAFPGKVTHSRDFKSAAPFAGERVLIIGSGNSGADIAIRVATQAAATSLVVRSPVHVSPQDLFGILPAQLTSMVLSRLPLALADLIARATLRLVTGNLAQYGLARPKRGPFRMLLDSGRVAILDTGLLRLIKQGVVRVTPGVARIAGNTVWFQDGSCATADSIILATGYSAGLEALLTAPTYQARISKDTLPSLLGQDQGDHLWFIGFRESPNGMLHDIKQQALQIAASLGQYTPKAAAAAGLPHG